MRIERLESRRLLSAAAGAVTVSSGTLLTGSAGSITVNAGTLVTGTVHKPGDIISVGGVKVSVTSKGTLLVEGSTLNDTVFVSTNKKSYTINILGTPSFFFSRNEIKRIRIEGGAGKDSLTFTGNHPDVPVSVLGGDGNDVIRSSPGTTLIGGEGNDDLSAAGVQTFVSGSTGDIVPIPGRQLPAGVVYNSIGVTSFLVVGSGDLDTGSLVEGGNGNDTITASAGPDTLRGGRGSDAITRTIFNDQTLIPIDDDISPGDTVESIEAFEVISVTTNVHVAEGAGVVTFVPQQ